MNKLDIPFNIDILIFRPEILKFLKPVTSLDIFDGATKNFNADGLYSTTIFGIIGTDARYKKYSYIDLKIEIIHPVIFNALVQLKGFYKDIIAGKEFATWNSELNDFVKSNAIEGETGYQFFIDHWKDIEFVERESTQREQNIKLIKGFKEKALMSKVFVMPAGYRDIETDSNGRESSDEINSLYYKLIAISNTINLNTANVTPHVYNSQRVSLQNTFNQIYASVLTLIEGKKNLLMGKWASRKIFYGTRNVITAMDTSVPILGGKGNVGFNNTAVGIYQCAKAMLPVTRHQLKTQFLSEVFISVSAPALLTNKKTLQSERVDITPETFDHWMTNEGLESIITSYKEPSIRHEAIDVSGYYLGLIYRGPDGTFKLIHGIDELPANRNKEDCTPITLTELFYCAIYSIANTYPCFVTRYPIVTDRSTNPSMIYLKSTIQTETRKELDSNWRVIGGTKIAYQFPVINSDTFNSLALHTATLQKHGADHDGDTCSFNVVLTDDAKTEVTDFLKNKAFYIGPDGRFTSNINVDTVNYVLHNLTGSPD